MDMQGPSFQRIATHRTIIYILGIISALATIVVEAYIFMEILCVQYSIFVISM